MPNVGKRQGKTDVECPTWVNVPANDGGLSENRAKQARHPTVAYIYIKGVSGRTMSWSSSGSVFQTA
ncbi:hypothetical protein HMPREF9135_0068 [Segatella baroniae F0067]|uniref:Uncharacterized protein n=1 Tax=Segatella baroniae F0067 TaxID=1115809 RepID=U2P778_9BACT|nr:hypothetical protein HMPREF9135_0068 [Segatella baroniae F0067]